MGLAFEKTGLAIQNNQYIDSKLAQSICQKVCELINHNAGQEHTFYKIGQAAFDSSEFMENDKHVQQAQSTFAKEKKKWKKIRFHNLVRLGGDIVKTGLSEFSKATVLGALLSYAKKSISE